MIFSMRRMPMRARKLRGVGTQRGIKMDLPKSAASFSKTSIVSPTSFASRVSSALNSVFPTICRVISIMSSWMSRTSPLFQPRIARSAYSTIVVPYAATRARWNAGCASRRCLSQKSPSLVSSPSPNRRMFAFITRPFSNLRALFTSTSSMSSG